MSKSAQDPDRKKMPKGGSARVSFRMPAEWEPHRGTWLAWPHQSSDWPGRFAPIPWVYAEICRILSRHEEVAVIVRDQKQEQAAKRMLVDAHADMKNIHFHECITDRSWLRDSGPIFVEGPDQEQVLLNWHFNAWAKYPNWLNDDQVPEFVSQQRGLPTVEPMFHNRRIVLEGGSIDVNGQGMLLTTEECLLSMIQHRNPNMDEDDYAFAFEKYLGIQKVVWLDRGIVGDDTHGHVDDLARFVGPRSIVAVLEKNEQDDNYLILQENRDRLKGLKDVEGKPIEVIPLPMPSPVLFRKSRLPASYANFYIANHVVIVPTFNDPQDRVALGILAELFPDRDVIGIHCMDLIWGLGTLHCMTQQEPLCRGQIT